MSIQGSFNTGVYQACVVKGLANINESIKSLGFNSEEQLQQAIQELKIAIATATDRNEDCSAKNALLAEYEQAYNDYISQREAEFEKKRRTNNAIVATISALLLIGTICALACL